eukprot:872850-Amphidinium_carterae.1
MFRRDVYSTPTTETCLGFNLCLLDFALGRVASCYLAQGSPPQVITAASSCRVCSQEATSNLCSKPSSQFTCIVQVGNYESDAAPTAPTERHDDTHDLGNER